MNSEVLSPSPLIFVNCVDLDSQIYIKSSNLVCCLFFNDRWISFPKDLRERRLFLFVRTDKLKELEAQEAQALWEPFEFGFYKRMYGNTQNTS